MRVYVRFDKQGNCIGLMGGTDPSIVIDPSMEEITDVKMARELIINRCPWKYKKANGKVMRIPDTEVKDPRDFIIKAPIK